MDIGRVGIWTPTLDSVSSAEAAGVASSLEELGFSTLWIPETAGRDPFVTATLLLAATTRLRVATGIANIYARDAMTMSNTQRALEEAFPGRFLLGLGVSHELVVNMLRKHDYSKPYSRMVEYLDEMDGAPFAAVGPTERPPTVLAALGPKMLRLAADRASGAHTYLVPVEHTAYARNLLGAEPILATELMAVIDADLDRARNTARKVVAGYLSLPNYANNLKRLGFSDDDIAGSDRIVDAIVACGDASAIRERVDAHLVAGASHVCVQVLERDPRGVPRAAWSDLAAALLDA